MIEPLKRYFDFALDKNCAYDKVDSVTDAHEGLLKLSLKSDQWRPLRGTEYFGVNPASPVLDWIGTVHISPFLRLTIRDAYVDGYGKAAAKLFGFIPVGEKTGPEIDQGELTRWIGTAVLFPPAFTPGPDLQWESLDACRALLTFRGINFTVWFGKQGEIIRISTNRYCAEIDGYAQWSSFFKNYEWVVQGNLRIRIPKDVGAIWHFENNRHFCYAKFHFTKVAYGVKEACES